VHHATQHGQAFVDSKVASVLNRLSYPRAYLDFETIAFGVPRWAGTKPYQQIPFQWSCHLEGPDGGVEERSFLDLSGNNPATEFAESLLEHLPRRGPVIVYNRGFEASRLKELAELLPHLGPKLLRIVKRLVDLLPIVRDHYYHPDMRGSWSLKSVVPTLWNDTVYSTLSDVSDGLSAQHAYRAAIDPAIDIEEKRALEIALKRYCATDTRGMFEVKERLLGHENDQNISVRPA
jgi:hypothetical protein